jgi:hypothetical protein
MDFSRCVAWRHPRLILVLCAICLAVPAPSASGQVEGLGPVWAGQPAGYSPYPVVPSPWHAAPLGFSYPPTLFGQPWMYSGYYPGWHAAAFGLPASRRGVHELSRCW